MRLRFDGFEIDPEEGRLLRNGVEVPLERRSFEMLCYLATHPGRLIEKQELLSHVWQVRSLSRGVLASTLAKLRKALGQAANQREPIETVHGRGYRFHGVVQRAQARPTNESEAVPASRASRARPFVGRKQALETLAKALEQAACGHGQLLLLVGDAGIGKTRMLEELSPRAQQHGFSIWEGSSHDGAGAPPYWPWVEILRKAQQELPAPKSHVPTDCAALCLLWPELVESSVVADAGAPSTRFRLFDELSRFLGSASK
jgi:DNA-binding winged helix-turn-helix (wHTH) protein